MHNESQLSFFIIISEIAFVNITQCKYLHTIKKTHCQLILYLKNVVWGLFSLVLTVVTLLLNVSVVRQLCTAI